MGVQTAPTSLGCLTMIGGTMPGVYAIVIFEGSWF